uniref:Uncharacterized protein n=1 Tax=Cucumis melo TaxID=3656 RepID=A0A9I9EBC4_CUCME
MDRPIYPGLLVSFSSIYLKGFCWCLTFKSKILYKSKSVDEEQIRHCDNSLGRKLEEGFFKKARSLEHLIIAIEYQNRKKNEAGKGLLAEALTQHPMQWVTLS